MPDKLDKIGDSLIQHGEENRRIYLMKLRDDPKKVIRGMEDLAERKQYGKIFCKVPERAKRPFEEKNYIVEASIPDFYRGKETVYFMSKFLNPLRKKMNTEIRDKVKSNLALARSKMKSKTALSVPSDYKIKRLKTPQMPVLAKLYDSIYETYPFPITDAAYLLKTLQSHIDYFGVFDRERLIAASSAEKDVKTGNAEMTDFATLPDYRGKGLATALLSRMERDISGEDIGTLYTIARALSPGMNITFARCGYKYSGTLVNNTQIFGRIEPMNVWYKHVG